MRWVGGDAFAGVATAFDAVDWEVLADLERWPDDALRVALLDIERLGSRLRAAQVRLVAEANRPDPASRDGCASPAAWLSHHLGVSGVRRPAAWTRWER
jgi:hypothetical protein